MASVNEVRLIGKLGADIELRSANGTDVCTVSIATDDYKGKGENRTKVTDWHRVVLWDQHARYAAEYTHKGDTVYVAGRLKTRKWQDGDGNDQYTTEVVADDYQGLRLRNAQPHDDAPPRDDEPAPPAAGDGNKKPRARRSN